jgi:hypothetical protein
MDEEKRRQSVTGLGRHLASSPLKDTARHHPFHKRPGLKYAPPRLAACRRQLLGLALETLLENLLDLRTRTSQAE